MDNKRERLIISISFTKEEKDIYEYAKNKPNCSYYIKKLIKKDIKEDKRIKNNTFQEIVIDDITDMLF